MVMPRYGWLGQHRYCCGFSGDQTSEWQTLRAEVAMTATAANVGFAHWSHDIGGFRGDPTPELYLRWAQFGALSPMYRSHGTKGSNRAYWSDQYAAVFPLMRQALAMRLALVPYLYAAARNAHDSGMAAVHALYIDSPAEPRAYSSGQAFMHGDDLLVRPVTEPHARDGLRTMPCEGGQKAPCISVWLPPSTAGWIYWGGVLAGLYTGTPVTGGNALVEAGEAQLPLFVKGGAVVPLLPRGALDATAAGVRGTAINWAVFTGALGTSPTPPCHPCPPTETNCFPCPPTTGRGTRCVDDGDSTAYEGAGGSYATQTLNYSLARNPQRVTATIGAVEAAGQPSLMIHW
jgi:alpha-glucosidase (family GH31 glycosyl hydrolase)